MSCSSTRESWAAAARLENETSGIFMESIHTASVNHVSGISEALEDSSIVMGINPSSESGSSPKEVRFSNQVNVIRLPEVQTPAPVRVSFSDDIVNINVPISGTRSTTPSPQSKKRVRFSCLKQPKQPLTHGLSLLQMLKRHTVDPLPSRSVMARKQVRFGALKCQKIKYPDLTLGHRDTEWDEAETRRVFKRECRRKQALQPLSSINESGEDDEWDST